MVAIDFNFILLIVELALLIPTLLLLVLGRKEERGRQALLTEITRAARMLSRQEYFHAVRSGMQAASKDIKGVITGSYPKTQEQEESVQGIVEQIRRTTGNNNPGAGRGVTIQYLMPSSQDRLSVAFRYKGAGADVRFHPGLVVSDLRYVIIDGRETVLGLPSTPGQNQPTREGFVIPSEGLSEILEKQFDSKWEQGVNYDAFACGILSEIKNHNPKVSTQLLSVQLGVPESEVGRLLSLLEVQQQQDVEK